MSAEPLDIRLEEGERLRKLGVDEEAVLDDIDTAIQLRKDHKRLREILFEVIDDGRDGVPWGLYHPFESVADSERTDFVNAVLAKLR